MWCVLRSSVLCRISYSLVFVTNLIETLVNWGLFIHLQRYVCYYATSHHHTCLLFASFHLICWMLLLVAAATLVYVGKFFVAICIVERLRLSRTNVSLDELEMCGKTNEKLAQTFDAFSNEKVIVNKYRFCRISFIKSSEPRSVCRCSSCSCC